MTLRSKLLTRFQDEGYRRAYVESFLDAYIATQIRALREQKNLSQTRLAEKAKMKQSQISVMEDVNHSSWKISTLKKIAKAFDLTLIVRFESFGGILPDIERFGRESLERPSFGDDPAFSVECPPLVHGEVSEGASTSSEIGVASCRVLMFDPHWSAKQPTIWREAAFDTAVSGHTESTSVGSMIQARVAR